MNLKYAPKIKMNAFNVVEFVILMTILTSLLSYIIPLIYQAVYKGKLAQCASNQKKLGMWITQYCGLYDGYFPAYENGWVNRIAEIGDLQVNPGSRPANEFACPSQSFKVLTGSQSPQEYWRGTYYGMNQHIASGLKNEFNEYYSQWIQANIEVFRYSSKKVILADAAGSNYWGINGRDPVVAGISRHGLNYAQSLLPAPATPFPYLRHINASGNFLFADGHVETKKSWPSYMDGVGTSGYFFWHGEHRRLPQSRISR